MDRTVRIMVCLALVLAAAWSSLSAQVPELRLTSDASFPDAFSLVGGVRELPDGRVMVADPLGQVLVVADMVRGTADTLGRPGQGPTEYRQPDGLFPLPADSTLLVDLGNGRLTVLAPDGRFGETMPIGQGEPGPGGMLIVLPRGVDAQGRIYFQAMGGRPGRQLPDSAPVLRFDRATGAVDTLGQVKLQGMRRSSSGGPNNQSVMIRPRPLTPQDAWAVAWDGRVAVARSADYRLEWLASDGVIRGAPVPYEPVRVRRADKLAWIDAATSGALMVTMEIENGRRRMGFRRGGGGRGQPNPDEYEWPETKPAFTGDGVWVTPEGEAWVERHVPTGSPRQFDVFGRDANRTATVTLPPGRRVVGFGRGTVYLTQLDEDDLQWLERYRRSAT